MNNNITGLHHVTALTSDAQQNIDFYSGILGLRMVKKTVNFDAPDVYHFYYGNEKGDPGTLLTFFPFRGMPRGRKGTGHVTVTSFSVPENSIDYWMKRLSGFGIQFRDPAERFDETFIYLEDQDGTGIELVANNIDNREGFTYGNIPKEYAIKGFFSVTLSEKDFRATVGLLTGQMDHRLLTEKNNRYRFSTGSGEAGKLVDILHLPDSAHGSGGSGTVHHVAFATPDDSTQLELRVKLVEGNIVDPTPVIDRQYFHSIYFREPGGVLFEAATSDIGMTLDETPEHLGEDLKLPPWEEKNRSTLEQLLGPVELNISKFKDHADIPDSGRR